MSSLAFERLQRHRVVIGRVLTPAVLVWLLAIDHAPVERPSGHLGLVGTGLIALGLTVRALSAGVLEKNRSLATDGIYAMVRNPLYLGSLLLLLGFNLIIAHPLFLLASLATFLLTHVPALRNEERGLAERFGAAWETYASTTPRFLPRLSRLPAVTGGGWSLRRFLSNHEHHTVMWTALLLSVIELYAHWSTP